MSITRRAFVKGIAAAATVGAASATHLPAVAAPAGAPAWPGGREVLPIPEIQQPYPSALYGKDVKPTPAKPLRPPESAPNVVIILIDDMGFGGIQRVRRPDPHAHARARGKRGPEVHPLPHHRALLSDTAGAPHRPQPPLRSSGDPLDIGRDGASPVSEDYPMGSANAFNGRVYSVTIDIGPKATAYYEPPENIWRRVMATQ